MKPIDFPEANKTLQKPRSMTDTECAPLRIYCDEKQCVSLWKPSLRERISILLFGKIWLSILSGKTQPPVSIWASPDGYDESCCGKEK